MYLLRHRVLHRRRRTRFLPADGSLRTTTVRHAVVNSDSCFRNFFNLYHRTCSLTGKKIISMYDSGVSFPVYDMHEWWSDKWDALEYGKAVDPAQPFLAQVSVCTRPFRV